MQKSAKIYCTYCGNPEKSKDHKYKKETLPGGESVNIIILILEHSVVWGGGQAEKYLHELSKRSTEGHSNASEFKVFGRKHLASQVQKCNTRLVLRKKPSLTDVTNSDIHSSDLYRAQ